MSTTELKLILSSLKECSEAIDFAVNSCVTPDFAAHAALMRALCNARAAIAIARREAEGAP